MRVYRRRRRMKRQKDNKTAKRVIIVILCVVLCVVLTVIFGHHLKNKAEKSRPDPDDTTNTPDTTEQNGGPATPEDKLSVEAGYLDLFTHENKEKSAKDAADEFFATSYTAASFILRDEEGSLLYTSEVASRLGQKSASALDIKELAKLLSEHDIYTVGCFASAAFDADTSPQMYEVILSYESALIRELFELGVDEILLTSIPFAADDMSASLEYISSVKSALPEGSRLGASIPYAILSDDGISVIAKELSKATDFIGIDMSGFGYGDIYSDTDAFIKENILYIQRYNMRMLLVQNESSVLTKQLDALGSNAIYNWQIIK